MLGGSDAEDRQMDVTQYPLTSWLYEDEPRRPHRFAGVVLAVAAWLFGRRIAGV